MSGALKAGSVYVAVSASIGEFTRNMQDMVKAVEQTAARIRAAASAIGNIGVVAAAGIAAAVREAAQANLKLGADLQHLRRLMYTLAGDLGDLFAPAIKSLVKLADGVVATFQRMSPGMKAQLATYAEWAAGAGLAVKTVGMGAGVVEGLAKAASFTLIPALQGATKATRALGEMSAAGFPTFKALFSGLTSGASSAASTIRALVSEGLPSITQVAGSLKGAASGAGGALSNMMRGLKDSAGGALSALWQVGKSILAVVGPVALGVVAVGALALAAGAVYAAWTDTSTGIKDSVMSAVESLKGYAAKLAAFFGEVFTGLKNFFLAIVASVLDVMLVQVKTLAGTLAKLAHAADLTDLEKKLATVQDLSGEKIVSALQDRMIQAGQVAGDALAKGVAYVGDVGRDAAKNVADSFSYSANGLKKLLGDTYKSSGLDKLIAQAEGLVGQLTGGNGNQAQLRAYAPEVEVGRAQLGDNLSDLPSSMRYRMAHGETEGMTAYREKLKADAKAIADAMAKAKEEIKDRFLNSLGEIKTVVDNFKEGMTASGGNPLAGLGAVALDLITKSKGFQDVMTMVNNLLQRVSDVLGQLLVPLEPLIGSALNLVGIVAGSLTPVFQLVGKLLEPLTPVLVIIGKVLQVLDPIIKMVAGALELLELPLQLLADVALKGLFEGIKYLGVGVLAVARGISWAWNGIIEGVRWLLEQISKLPLLGALQQTADSLKSIEIDTNSLADAQNALLNTTWDMADAQGAATAAQLKNTAALNDATDSLSNVPQMWANALRLRQTVDSQASGSTSSSSSSTSSSTHAATPPAPSSSTPAPQSQVVNNYNVQVTNPKQFADQVQQHLADRSFRSGGNRWALGTTADGLP